MKTGAHVFIALRYLLGRAREGGRYLRGAAAGIALSLIPIMVTLIVADGMIRGITDRYLELGTGHIQVYGYTEPLDLEKTGALLKGIPGVRGVWAERQGLALIMGNGGKAAAAIRATEPSFWTEPGSVGFLETIVGEAAIQSGREVLLGEELARTLGAEPGKPVFIMTLQVSPEGRNIPRTLAFTVRGIVSSGYRELDSLWCLMSFAGGERLLPPDLFAPCLIAKVEDPYGNADAMARLFSRALGPGYGVYTWKTLQQSQYRSYESTRQLLLFIMALIVMVAAVNVSSATSMLVIERQRDIAVLKAAGASPGDTSRIFLWGAFLTGLCGGSCGIVLGLGIGCCINPIIRGLESILGFFSRLFGGGEVKILDPGYYLETIPIIVDWKAVALIGLFTIASSVAASYLPARRAGKTAPIQLLQKY